MNKKYDNTNEIQEEFSLDVPACVQAPASPAPQPPVAEPAAPAEPVEEPASQPEPSAERPAATPRYNKRGRRRGKYPFAVPVGVLVSLLSIVGVVAIIMNIVGYVRQKNDTTALKEELYYYLQPLLTYSPEPFSNAAKSDQDAFLNAAAYRLMMAEKVRMLRENDSTPQYPMDEDTYSIAIPEEEVEESYAYLFGPKAKLEHRSIEASGIQYSEGDGYYYVPFVELNIGYEIVIDKVVRKADRYEVHVGFVPVADVQYDEHGEQIPATIEQATHAQVYTLTRDGDDYYVKSCKDVALKK